MGTCASNLCVVRLACFQGHSKILLTVYNSKRPTRLTESANKHPLNTFTRKSSIEYGISWNQNISAGYFRSYYTSNVQESICLLDCQSEPWNIRKSALASPVGSSDVVTPTWS